MLHDVEMLERLYERFNARDMQSVLACMHQDVIWANGMAGGHVHGREEVRSYWTRQWAMVDVRVDAPLVEWPYTERRTGGRRVTSRW